MIAKRVHREKGTSNFRRLANYILDSAHEGEKVAWARVTNCISDDPRWAVKEIHKTQARNTRSKGEKTYHLVVSLAPGERPNAAQLRDIEDHICAALGYADHQRVSVVHTNTDCLHLHLAVNKVNPVTFRCVTPRRDYYLLDAACRALEEKHGLKWANRIGDRNRQAQGPEEEIASKRSTQPGKARQRNRPADMEAHAGEESLLRWIQESAGETLRELRSSTATWQEAHETLARSGLEVVPRGAGLVLRDRSSGIAVPASQVDRSIAFKALTARWGPYEPPGPLVQKVGLDRRYQKGPIHRHRDSAKLYTEFARERESALETRKTARLTLEAQLKLEHRRILSWHAESRAHIKSSPLGRLDKLAEYARLSAERRNDLATHRQTARQRRAEIAGEHPLRTWQDHLRRRAEQGDTSALEVLRSRDRRQHILANALLCATDAAEARHIILEHLRPSVQKDGVVIYQLDDGSKVRDEQRQVGVDHPTAGAVFLALMLAQERFGRHPILVEGTEEFKRQVANMTAVRGVELRFADPSMEQARQTALEQHRSQTAPAALEAFTSQRNTAREKVTSILHHRAWTLTDHGQLVYRGRRHLADGTEAVLLERGGAMLVKVVSSAQAAKASQWQLGRLIEMDARGRFIAATDHRRSH